MRIASGGRWRGALLLLLAAVLALPGCVATPTVEYTVVGTDLEPLRAAFNAHADGVRAVLLGSPT